MAFRARRRLVGIQRGEYDGVAQVSVNASSIADVASKRGSSLSVRPGGRSASTRRTRGAQGLARLPFASLSMTKGKLVFEKEKGGSSNSCRNLTFVIASASEKPSARPQGVPQWRITAGDLAAGATAGCAVEAALYPIDTIKTRIQNMKEGGFRALFATGGGRGLYAGVLGNLVGVAPASAIFMAVYEPVKKSVMGRVDESRQYLGPVVAGAAAGVAASVIRVPTEVVKQRLQTKEFANAVRAVTAIAAKEGVRGLYAGYGALLLRDLPFDAIEFVAYEQLKKSYATSVQRDLNSFEVSVVGAIAGAITGFTTTPFDVLKTRLMTQGASGQYRNVLDATVKIAREEGFAAFFRGWEPRVTWIAIGGSVFFTALELAKTAYAPKLPPPPAEA